ncbi:hypothetical protein ACVWYN_001519 [Pedobacter sp. UYP24]
MNSVFSPVIITNGKYRSDYNARNQIDEKRFPHKHKRSLGITIILKKMITIKPFREL